SPLDYQQVIPEVIHAMGEVHAPLDALGLERSLHHLVQLRASQLNQCAFCVRMHTREARGDGESSERLDRLVVRDHCNDFTPREKAALAAGKVRHQPPRERQERLLEAFHAAIASGVTAGLTALFSEEVELCADGGGKVPTLGHILHGKAKVLAFISDSLRGYWRDYQWLPAELNGGRGVILAHGDQVSASVTFAYDDEGRVSNIYIVRNPEKLAGLR